MDNRSTAEFVSSSKHRKNLLYVLGRSEGGLTPKEISQEMGVDISQASRTLKEMEERELVACVTPDSKKGKIYEIKEKGRKVRRQIPRILKDHLLQNVMAELDREGLPYARNVTLEGEVGDLHPDLSLLKDGSPRVALEIKSGKVFGRLKEPLLRRAQMRRLYSLAFLATEAKKENDFEIWVVLHDVERGEVEGRTKERLDAFVDEGWFDNLFYGDEVDRIVETAKEKT